jgi:hypothetical protein
MTYTGFGAAVPSKRSSPPAAKWAVFIGVALPSQGKQPIFSALARRKHAELALSHPALQRPKCWSISLRRVRLAIGRGDHSGRSAKFAKWGRADHAKYQ